MDAVEDRELKLQRASGDLVTEFSEKLPSLLWRFEKGTPLRTPRKWAQISKTEKLVNLLEPFQEWPQLLDPHLQKLLPPLVNAFLEYLIKHRSQYGSQPAKPSQGPALYPLPKAICRLLYTFCKVRGAKVISRFLNNEPKYLGSVLRAFVEWDSASVPDSTHDDALGPNIQTLQWEERYVMLVWLSHLLLAPFDLSSLSSDDIPIPYDNLQQIGTLPENTPMIAKSLLSLALHYINVPGKEREAATALLARLTLRGDMQALGFLTRLTDWAFAIMQPADDGATSVYSCIGVLSFIARLAGSGQLEIFAPLLRHVFEQTISVSQGTSKVSTIIKTSAIARKIVVKILRNITVMALSLSERGVGPLTDDQLSTILEDAIDHFLVALSDKDTPVRFASSKALSVIALKLDPEMGAEVIEAVIGSLGENILYEKDDGTLITPFEARNAGLISLKRNTSGVDAQQWQGLMLTLSHLLFRRAPPTHQLPDILQSLISCLDFEQRSSTGSSVGTGVRDAACFGVWALSRKYTTSELQAIQAQIVPSISGNIEVDVLQKLAVELVCSACVDPSGNIRRGASAALQELIGRHPNMITEGIPLVQVVDYHAVARRSRAMIDVAKSTASLDLVYWGPLLDALMNWRGIGSPDAESRRHAARSIGSLSRQGKFQTISFVLQRLLGKLARIPRGDVESRHGCLLSIALAVDAYISEWDASPDMRDTLEGKEVSSHVARLWEVFESPYSPTDNDLTLQSSRPELTAESSSCFISSLCRATILVGVDRPSEALLDRVLHILSLSVSRGDDISIQTSSEALSLLFPLLSSAKQDTTVQTWFSHLRSSSKLSSGRGQILALGAVFKQLEGRESLQQGIIMELLRCAGKEETIEKRVLSVRCFATGIVPHTIKLSPFTQTIAHSLPGFLNDYTTDRRGDIGSLIRIEAIEVARILELKLSPSTPIVFELAGCLCRLACEKLDKVRLQASLCLQDCFWEMVEFNPFDRKFEHVSDVSSQEYFFQLLSSWGQEWLRLPLLQGLATSAVAGAEGLVRASRAALIQFLNSHNPHSDPNILVEVLQVLSTVLSDNLPDDRYAIPIIELIAFLLDSYHGYTVAGLNGSNPVFRKVFLLVQKAHFRSANIARMEGAVKVYAALSGTGNLRGEVLKKLTAMLLHPFPRVRSSAAEYLFTLTESETLKYEDWSAAPKELKEKVDILRGNLVPAT
ncbi:Tubulin-specific chaperone D C-terminal [Penicillium pulvis]|uniref:Tubulin-specific chaperone D C-terminal n=1 Tax=Penicillium pulvis TaxID=1562058 RepID=UPI002548703E|nr:Tubulin-specific chaperone D C-terminal [Penicillium pulvis]KAJ5802960.1 Tubulin-specific chaperone D C-terminal [Penicillium pulvis]